MLVDRSKYRTYSLETKELAHCLHVSQVQVQVQVSFSGSFLPASPPPGIRKALGSDTEDVFL
jgi:hypothetical protein